MNVRDKIAGFLRGGHDRRAWLDEQNAALMTYVPPELRAWTGLAAEANPVVSMERAGTAANKARTSQGWDRVAALGDVASNVAGVVAPVAAAKGAGMPAVQALEEALLGMSAQPRAAVGQFAADESGALRLFHGSPHDFDKFSMDKIGTGEGAQDLGRGLYFYDEEFPATLYRNPAARWGDIQAMRRYSEMGPGRVYEVDVNARPEQILDVKTPAAELPIGSRMAARRDARIANEADPEFQDVMRQHLLVQHIMDGAEDDMLADGFAGFKRKKFDGETEVVILDENLIEIVRKYGIAGAATVLGVSQADIAQAMGVDAMTGQPMAATPPRME